MRKYRAPPKAVIKAVNERISILLEKAREKPDMADRYLVMARKLSQKNKVRMPWGSSRLYCRHCNTFFFPGKNVRIRTREGKQIYYCLKCKRHKRFPLRKK